MNVMQSAGPAEPVPQDRSAFHPKALDMHAVVQVAEDPECPGEDDAKKQELKQHRSSEEVKETGEGDEKNAGGNEPFEANISQRDLTFGCVKILLARPLFLLRTIEKQMVLHMVQAQKADPA